MSVSSKNSSSSFRKYLKRFWILVVLLITIPAFYIVLVSIGVFGTLPTFEELENPKSNLASEIYSSDHKILGKYYYQNRSNVQYKDISPNLINALKATEDIRFEEHSGVDIRGLLRVMFRTILLGQSSSGGGSTITQQLAKNLFPRKKFSTSFDKVTTKIKEWITAIKLERNYTKEEIIVHYLNTVEFGSNAFGIKSAARTFFNKTPDSLTVDEAAVLVGLLKAPTLYSPVKNSENSLKRRNIVLTQMGKYKFISQKESDSLKVLPIKLSFLPENHNTGLATYFREHLRLELLKWCEEHKKADGSAYNLYRDGLKIYTTIDSKMQKYAEEAVTQHLKDIQDTFFKHWKGRDPWGPHKEVLVDAMKRSDRYIMLKKAGASQKDIENNFNKAVNMRIFSWKGDIDTVLTPMDSIKYYKHFLQTGFMSMEPQTGYVKAWVGGIDYKHFKYDHVKEGKRQVGSTFKPVVYTLAMQEGYSPCYKVPNVPVTFISDIGEKWTPENSDGKYGGMISLKKALAESINCITAFLMKQFGPQAIIEMARKLGITSPMDPYPAICLGTPDISVYEMVGAYSTFANKGVWTEPIYITRIEDKNGNIIQEFIPKKIEAVNEETAYLMLNLLEGVVQYGTGVRLRYKYKLNQPMAGKTGTTQNQSDGWYMGITPDLVSGVWVGCEDRSVHFRSIHLGQGATMALPIWAFYMQKVYADKSLEISQGEFEKPSQELSIETDCTKYQSTQENNSFTPDFGF